MHDSNIIDDQQLDNLVEDFKGRSLPNNPEKLIIHVVEQQKLGNLKTSQGPVEQMQEKPKKKKPMRKNKKKKQQQQQQENADHVDFVSSNAEDLVNELRRQGKNAVGPSLTFLTQGKTNQNFDFRAGRQTKITDKVIVPGFPNGLPNGVPEGVKIALASAVKGIYRNMYCHTGNVIRFRCHRSRWRIHHEPHSR